MSQDGLIRSRWGVIVESMHVVVGDHGQVDDCHHCCRCSVAASAPSLSRWLEPSGSGRCSLTPPLGVTIR